ncbi:MAG: VOC family protein, partial [Bacteroidota bacterium]
FDKWVLTLTWLRNKELVYPDEYPGPRGSVPFISNYHTFAFMHFLPSPALFLNKLFTCLEPQKGLLNHLQLDHICYRVTTVARYEELKEQLLKTNKLLVESPINGRRIATFRMAQPFTYEAREIWLLELPEPKSGSPYPEGWEHAEFVTDRPLAEFADWLTKHLGIKLEDIDTKGLSKQLNAEVRLRLPDGLSVKFHELPLDEVIAIELREEQQKSEEK